MLFDQPARAKAALADERINACPESESTPVLKSLESLVKSLALAITALSQLPLILTFIRFWLSNAHANPRRGAPHLI